MTLILPLSSSVYSGFNNAPHLHTGDVSITELLRVRYELDLTNERDIQIVLIDYNGKVSELGHLNNPCEFRSCLKSCSIFIDTTSHAHMYVAALARGRAAKRGIVVERKILGEL